MELILMRHATTQGNLERRFIGTLDIPILPQGEELAREVAPTLPAVDHLYHSPLLRCVQTAKLLWPQAPGFTAVPQLRETDFGPFEGKNHEELKDDPLYQKWLAGGEDMTDLPVGESTEEVVRRVEQGIRFVLADAKARGFGRVAVVAHGGTLMALMASFGAPKRENYYDWICQNCSGWWVEATEEPLTLTVKKPMGRNLR